MQQRPLGSTGILVSILGLGAANLGGVYGTVDERTAEATVTRAFELGVTLFDASPYYGATRAESVLGRALSRLPRERIVLATKCGRRGPDDFDFSPAALERSVQDSLQRLQTDRVDILQLHDVEFGDLERILTESLPKLHEMKARGLCRAVGITGLPLQVFRQALRRGAQLDVVLSYCHHTLFDTTLLALLPALQARGIGVLNASPFAMGLLSAHGPRDWHPAPERIRAACRRAVSDAAAQGRDLQALAVQFACREPRIASTLCGTADPIELERNVRALQQPLDERWLAEVRALLAEIQDQSWPQGRAENQ